MHAKQLCRRKNKLEMAEQDEEQLEASGEYMNDDEGQDVEEVSFEMEDYYSDVGTKLVF